MRPYLTAPLSIGHLYLVFKRRHLREELPRRYGNGLKASSRARLGWLLLAGSVASCAHSAETSERGRSVSALARGQAVQAELRALRGRFFSLPRNQRQELTPELVRLIERHPADPASHWARVYLAFNQIDSGKIGQGKRLAEGVRAATRGRVRDFATVAVASGLTSEGKPRPALILLAPLQGKVIEPEERHAFYEELTRAARSAKNFDQAIHSAYEWVTHGSLVLPEASQLAVQRLIQAVPTVDLQVALGHLTLAVVGTRGERSDAKARVWFLKTLRQTLIQRALQQKDPQLAGWLLGATTARERLGSVTTELSRLATTGAPAKVRVIGRRLGFIFGSNTDQARNRSAAAFAGILAALDLTSETRTVSVELKTESADGSPGSMMHALEALASEGVALLIAGVDRESATLAASYASQERLPVLLLVPPAEASSSEYVFDLGVDPEAELRQLEQAASAAGLVRTAQVGVGASACAEAAQAVGVPKFPVQAWQSSKVQALLLLGDEACSESAVAELGVLKFKPILHLGLESAALSARLESFSRLVLGAGSFPRRPVSEPWFQVLGHDAAVLGAQTLAALPRDASVDDRTQARRLHALARQALTQARVALWSSEAQGFNAAGSLPRTLTLQRLEPGPSRRKALLGSPP